MGSEDEQEGYQLVDDALEESFSVLEDNTNEPVVFKDDDFLPDISKLPPPDEKPPPLPSVPPPQLDVSIPGDSGLEMGLVIIGAIDMDLAINGVAPTIAKYMFCRANMPLWHFQS